MTPEEEELFRNGMLMTLEYLSIDIGDNPITPVWFSEIIEEVYGFEWPVENYRGLAQACDSCEMFVEIMAYVLEAPEYAEILLLELGVEPAEVIAEELAEPPVESPAEEPVEAQESVLDAGLAIVCEELGIDVSPYENPVDGFCEICAGVWNLQMSEEFLEEVAASAGVAEVFAETVIGLINECQPAQEETDSAEGTDDHMLECLQRAIEVLGVGIEITDPEIFAAVYAEMYGVWIDMERVINMANEIESPDEFAMKFSMMVAAGEF